MADNEFLDEYILDAKEQLSELNEALLLIEKNSCDVDSINRIFRAAHTLKGNSATMGFMEVADLAHKVEDVLNAVREGGLVLDADMVDILFEAMDALEALVEGAGNGQPLADASAIIERLESIISLEEDPDGLPSKEPEKEETTPVSGSYKIKIILAKDTPLKSVRAFMVVKKLESLGRILRSAPELDDIDKGNFGDEFTIYLETETDPENIGKQIKTVANVEGWEIELWEERTFVGCDVQMVKDVQSIRVSIDKLDALVDLVGELVINKSRLFALAKGSEDTVIYNTVSSLDRLTRDLQDVALSLRMVKVSHIFDKFPRMVRDLSKKEGKEIEFILEGTDIELDRTVLDKLGDPLVHLLRNSVDHGIEDSSEREKAGKSKKGTIILKASRVKDHVEIDIIDDGRGIDGEALKKKAGEKGLLCAEEAGEMDEETSKSLVFMPGLSCAKEVTDVSGRGVGMDVVKNTISKLGGSVFLKSEVGEGTTFTLKLPLSLAIIKALLIEQNGKVFAVPTKDVVEVLDAQDFKIKSVKGREVIIHRGSPLPILRLGRELDIQNGDSRGETKFVVVESAKKKVGLAVEEILRQEEVVIKPLGEGLKDNKAISGATILGDGQVALILDVHNLI